MLSPKHLTEIKGTQRIEMHTNKENLKGDNGLEMLQISGWYKLEGGITRAERIKYSC